MRKSLLATTIAGLLMTSVASPVYSASNAALEQRIERLERMLENPVLLQLSRRLGEQQREIQMLQDENDRLKRDIQRFKNTMNDRYSETDERLSVLEGGKAGGAVPVAVPTVSAETITQEKAVAGEPEVNTQAQNKLELVQPEGATDATANVESAKTSTDELDKKTVAQQTPKVDAKVSTDAKTEVKTEVEAKPVAIKTHSATEAEKAAYRAAFSLMGASKYDESIAAFEKFLQQYPESALASNSAYWAGEGYLLNGKDKEALESFMMVLNSYPDSSKVPDATLRAGDCYDNLGQADKAKAMYEKVIAERPHSKAAKTARKRLEP